MQINANEILSVPFVRKISDTVFSGPTLEGNLANLQKMKSAGIETIVDFRGKDAINLAQECKQVGLDYFQFSLDHTLKSGKTNWTPQFVEQMKKFFGIMNKGKAYIGCQYGIHRTDAALAYNYFLNPQAKAAPAILAWDSSVSMKSTINMLVKMIRKSVRDMSSNQKQLFNIVGDKKQIFEHIFKEKIGKMIARNIRNVR